MGREYEWNARLTDQQPNRSIGRESTSAAGDSGTVHFESLDRSCRLQVSMELNPPGGIAGQASRR